MGREQKRLIYLVSSYSPIFPSISNSRSKAFLSMYTPYYKIKEHYKSLFLSQFYPNDTTTTTCRIKPVTNTCIFFYIHTSDATLNSRHSFSHSAGETNKQTNPTNSYRDVVKALTLQLSETAISQYSSANPTANSLKGRSCSSFFSAPVPAMADVLPTQLQDISFQKTNPHAQNCTCQTLAQIKQSIPSVQFHTQTKTETSHNWKKGYCHLSFYKRSSLLWVLEQYLMLLNFSICT